MCQYLNEENSTHAFLVAKNEELKKEVEDLKRRLDACQLRYIEATNPGIDMEMVKQQRGRQHEQ